MNLEGLLALIVESNTEDWYTLAQGPLFRYHLMEIESGQNHWTEIDSHHTTAIYKPDVSITMSFGMDWVKDFKEPWANKFPDPSASGDYVDVYYSGSLVYRDVYVTVDGGRAKLPVPKSRAELVVPEDYHRFIQLISSIQGSVSRYDEYFERAGFTVGEGKWPKV